jgi:hypothetical protein
VLGRQVLRVRSRFGRAASTAILAAALTALAVAAWGCGGEAATPPIVYVTPSLGVTETPVPSETVEASAAGSPSPTPASAPGAATITKAKVTRKGSTGTCVDWTATIMKPVVGGIPEEAASAANAVLDEKVTEAMDDFETVMGYGGGGSGPCTLTGDYSVAYSSTTLLSLRLTFVQYTGGASTSTIAGSASFRTDGTPVELADLFTSASAGAAKLSTESRTRLLSALGSQGVDADWVNPGTLPQISSFDSAWAFTGSGLELTFQEVTVAPHALGTPRIVIPWSSLAGVLDPNGPAGEFI